MKTSKHNKNCFVTTFLKWFQICRVFIPYAGQHWKWFLRGSIAALFVIGIRLALPWPVRTLIKPWLHHSSHHAADSIAAMTSTFHDSILMGGLLFFFLLLALGLADLLERLYFARFAIGTVRDIRAEVFQTVIRTDLPERAMGSGELVARLIGDTARIKAGLKGLLVHGMTNGITFAAMSIILLWLNLTLGLIFTSVGVVVAALTIFGATRMFRKAMKFRKKEGKLAHSIQQAWTENPSEALFAKVNRSSGKHEASLTRIQGLTTWCTHAVFGASILALLWTGTRAVAAGRLDAGSLLVFMMYALIMCGPIVRLSRQGARSGKILACGARLKQLLDEVQESEKAHPHLTSLRDRLRLVGLKVKSTKQQGRRRRLGPIDLEIHAGQRIAILGTHGSGKTTFIEIISGLLKPKSGQLLWDEVNLEGTPAHARSQQIFYLSQVPSWRRRSVRQFLNLPDDGVSERTLSLFRVYQLQPIIDRLPNGLDAKVSSLDLSLGERKLLGLARALFAEASFYLLDDPVVGMTEDKAQEVFSTIFEAKKGTTVLVAFSSPIALECFDRVIYLRKGRVVFDGSPRDWLALSDSKVNADGNLSQKEKPMSYGLGGNGR